MTIHPNQALFEGRAQFPVIPSCDHYVGSERFAAKALALQKQVGPLFDITLDLEDGAAVGTELALLETFIQIVRSPENTFRMTGIRVHDYHSPFWKKEIEAIVERVGDIVSHITIPKTRLASELGLMIEFLQQTCSRVGLKRKIPVHVLIETPLALEQLPVIASLPWIRVFDFGIMDFVSCHYGAIPATATTSPGQFDHALLRRAKGEIVATCFAHDIVPAHNVTIAYGDAKQTAEDARRARVEFGFLRMWSIHPTQIEPILEGMRPDFAEVMRGSAVLLAAYKSDWGPVSIENVLYDRAIYRYYWGLIQRARLSGFKLSPEIEAAFFANRQ